MAKVFKVKYKEREALARALRREIETKGLVDTRAMKKGVRIAATNNTMMNLNGLFIEIVVPFYYRFQDSFASDGYNTNLWNGGVIVPQDVTVDWLRNSKTQQVITEIIDQYIQWRVDNFPLFEVARIPENPRVYIGFDFYGDDSGKWNGKKDFKKA